MKRIKKWVASILCKMILKLDDNIIISDLSESKKIITGKSSAMLNKSLLERKIESMNKLQ